MQSYQNVCANDVPIDVRDQAIAANVSSSLRDMLSARMPVKRTAVAKNTVKVAPASNEYFSVEKFGIACCI
jgi:hypothetical protein